ncbi:MAG TPA: class I SAM-dependent methyltransferase [Gemmataceae bacterium]|nr:class I SAM-dependent methyltransferase [Gemmataceae bacterium]
MKGVPGTEGDRRLRPALWEYNYYLMTLLRQAFEEQIRKHLEPGKPARVIDFGCGTRPYEVLFQGRAQYVGVDLADNPKADVHATPGQPVPLPDGAADMVVSTQVLEHVVDVDGYLAESARLLKPGGVLLLSTHGFWTYHPYPTDVRRWTCQGLKMDIEKHGFRVESMCGCLGPLAYTTQLRLQLLRGALYQVGRVAYPLIGACSVMAQVLMMLEDAITPKEIGQQNSAIYVVAARKLG